MRCFSLIVNLFLLSFMALNTNVQPAWGYIPDFRMILSRTAENHGHGIYKIEQDVSFQEANETSSVREIWYVKDSQQMRLEAREQKKTEDSLNIVYIYKGQNRFYVEGNGVRKSSRSGEDWFEPYLYFRLQKLIHARMIADRIVPPTAFEEKKSTLDVSKNRAQQSFLRLSRTGGVVNYSLGQPTPHDATSLLPGLWIEQDVFNVRKIRLPSEATISANEYSSFANRFQLATQQTIRWQDKTVQIRVVNVKALPNGKEVLDLFEERQLDFGKNPRLATHLPATPLVNEFYKRFR